MEARNYLVEDLFYNTSPVLMSIQYVYDRFDDPDKPPVPVDGVTHLADINGDVHRALLMSEGDPKTQMLLRSVYPAGKPSIIGTIGADEANGIGIIAIRGTRGDKEWIENFEFASIPFTEVADKPMVHLGFRQVYQSFRENLLDQLHLLDKYDRVIVTGHSLGAATATLCLLDLIENNGGHTYEGCTFASPRVFWGNTKSFDQKVAKNLRVANPVNIVTQLPFIVPFAYFHVVGGLDIRAKIVDFHDLQSTYRDRLLERAQKERAAGNITVALKNAEDVWLEEEYLAQKLVAAVE